MRESYCLIKRRQEGLFQLRFCVRLHVFQPAYAILCPLVKQTLLSPRDSFKRVRESGAGPVWGLYGPDRRIIPCFSCCHHCLLFFHENRQIRPRCQINTYFISSFEMSFFSNSFCLVGGEMSLCGAADGHLLVHGGSSFGCHCNAPSLPFPHFGNSSIQESMHSVLPGDKFSLPQRSLDGVVHRGVGPASPNSPEGAQYCWAAAGEVSRFILFDWPTERRFSHGC